MNNNPTSRCAWLRSGLAALFAGLILLTLTGAARAAEPYYRTSTGQFGGSVAGNAGGRVTIQGFLGSAFRNSPLLPLADTVVVYADGARAGNLYTGRTAISGVDYVGIGSLNYTIPRTAKRGSTIRLEFHYPGRNWYGSSKGYGTIRVVQ